MKKIVVISGSPRKKGYTMSIVKIIEDMMKKVDESIEFKYEPLEASPNVL